MTRIASKATKGKGKRWLKGHSSTSNPEVKRHRAKASQVYSGNVAGQSASSNRFKLTKDVLDQFDAMRQPRLGAVHNGGVSEWLDEQAEGHNQHSAMHTYNNDHMRNLHLSDDIRSNVSAASVWSNCSNISFARFLNGFDPKSHMHKSMLTVLATIREAIEAEKGAESETEYFAGLMVTLNCVDSEEKLTATLALIQMVLKHVPDSVLKLKFNETADALMKIITERLAQTHAHNGYLVKSVIKALTTLLQHQDGIVWQQASTQKIFRTLLSLVVHIKPRVRKAATFAVISIVGGETNVEPDSAVAIARKLVAEFCVAKLKEHLTTTREEHQHIVLYTLALLCDTMFVFPYKYTQAACEAILTHMKFDNVLIENSALHTLYSFFVRRPSSSVLSAELNGRLMNALYEYQPNINNEQPLNAWCIALKECLLSLHNLDPELSHLHLLKYTQTTLGSLLSDSHQVHACICNALKVVFTTVVDNHFPTTLLNKVYVELESFLKYKYSQAWVFVIPMLSEFFIDNESALASLAPIFQRLAILHESNDLDVNKAIDGFFAKAVAFYGPKAIVQQCPIVWGTSDTRTTGEEFSGEFTNPWLLTILRDHTHNKSHLSLFANHFLPMADDISKKAIACKKLAEQLREKLDTNADSMETDANDNASRAHESLLVAQRELKRCVRALWALLPALCRSPIDAPQVFTDSKFAQRLGQALNDRELFTYPLAALRHLLNCSSEVTDKLAPYAKNYVVILFNLLTNENESTQVDQGMRAPMLVLVQQFIPHLFTNENSIKYFYSVYQKIREELNKACSDFKRNALLDLLGAMLVSPKGFKYNEIKELYEQLAKPLIEETKSTADQKKGFKIIEKIIQSSSPECIQYITNNFDQVLNFLYLLISSKNSFTAPSTRAFALRSIRCLIDQYLVKEKAENQTNWILFFEKILPFVLNCLLLKSAKAKKNAESLLLTMDKFFDKHVDSMSHKVIKQVLEPLRQTDSDLSISERIARLHAINLLYLNRYNTPTTPKDIQCDIADVILDQIKPDSQYLSDRNIINHCFDFITNFVRNATPDILNSNLEHITCYITNLPKQHRTKYRERIRTLLVKLIRKFGYNFISSMISEDYRKVLKNVKKLEERKKKNKHKENQEDDEDSNIEDDRKSRRSRKSVRFADSSDEEEAELEQLIDDDWKGNDDVDDDGNTVHKRNANLDIMSRLSSKTTKSFIREEVEGDPFDLLSSQATKNVFSKIPNKFRQPIEDNVEQETKAKLPISDDGRIMVGELLDQMEAKDNQGSVLARKRSRTDVSDDQSDDDDSDLDDRLTVASVGKSNYKPGGRGIHRPVSVSGDSVGARSTRTTNSKASRKSTKSKRNAPHINKGDAYQSKKAAGDMKRRGMPDPYAYIPLNPIALNKRKALKYKGEFNAVVKGAKKGAAAGARARKRAKK